MILIPSLGSKSVPSHWHWSKELIISASLREKGFSFRVENEGTLALFRKKQSFTLLLRQTMCDDPRIERLAVLWLPVANMNLLHAQEACCGKITG